MKHMKWKQGRHRNNVSEESEELPFNGIPMFLNLGTNNNESPSNSMFGGGPIRVVENHVYFYGDIDENSALDLNRVLHEVDIKLQNTKNVLGDEYTPIVHLHVNTFGGSIFAAFSTVDVIRNLKSKVYTYVEGSVASAGTLIIGVGAKRFVGSYAHILIHQLSGGMYGKYAELQDEMENCNKLMRLLKDFYKKHTKMPMKKLDELLSKDIWLSPQEAIDYGLVDEIR